MKKRFLSLFLALALCTALISPSASAYIVSDGNYWKNMNGKPAQALIDQGLKGGCEPILILYYSRMCGYSQKWIPQFRDYAEANGITVYGIDVYTDGESGWLDFGVPVSGYGGYPVAIRYWGEGGAPTITGGVRSMEAFLQQVNAKKPAVSDGFEIGENGNLLNYHGSATDVVIPSGVTAIGPKAFFRNETMRTVTIPDGVTSIGDNAFQSCSALTTVSMPDSVTKLAPLVFDSCTALTSVRLSRSLTELPYSSFNNCRSLRRIELPQSLTTIREDAFMNCSRLVEITIPAGVTSIEEHAFAGCYWLHTVRFQGRKPAMPGGDSSPFYYISAAGIYPAGDSTWGSLQELQAQHPFMNWGARPGECLSAPSSFDDGWNDGTISSWAVDEVRSAYCYKLVPFYNSVKRSYNQPVTRKNFCQILMKVVSKHTGQEEMALYNLVGSSPFQDTDIYAVVAANYLGLVNGKGNGVFDPDGFITREEAATMLARTASLLGVPPAGAAPAFTDGASISSWAQESVGYVATLSSPVNGRLVMGGTGNGAFSPKAYYSLEQTYCSLLRLYQAAAEKA